MTVQRRQGRTGGGTASPDRQAGGKETSEQRSVAQSVDTWGQYQTKDLEVLSCNVQPRGWRQQGSVITAYCSPETNQCEA